MTIESYLSDAYNLWEQKKIEDAQLKCCSIEFVFCEFSEGIINAANGLRQSLVAVIKLPVSFMALAAHTKNGPGAGQQLLMKWHQEWPGITDAIVTLLKAAICFVNIIIGPLLGFWSPQENFRYHVKCGIISGKRTKFENPAVTKLKDIVGMDEIKNKVIREVINPLKKHELLPLYGLKGIKGVLLYGPPGCGKTYFADAIAGELSRRIFKITAGDIASIYVHGATGEIKRRFDEIKSNAPCVLFIDEFDGIASKRAESDTSLGKAHNETVTELLRQIDDIASSDVLIIAATNRNQDLDPSVTRSGRFDTEIEIGLPDDDTKQKLFEFYTKKLPCDIIDSKKLALMCKNASCSDIKAMVDKSALIAFDKVTDANSPVNITQAMIESAIENFKPQKKQTEGNFTYYT